jgi:hypothetical protein
MITKETASNKILAFLQHRISQKELVNWAENAVNEGEFEPKNEKLLIQILGYLGLTNEKAFGLNREDCELFMKELGYEFKVEADK